MDIAPATATVKPAASTAVELRNAQVLADAVDLDGLQHDVDGRGAVQDELPPEAVRLAQRMFRMSHSRLMISPAGSGSFSAPKSGAASRNARRKKRRSRGSVRLKNDRTLTSERPRGRSPRSARSPAAIPAFFAELRAASASSSDRPIPAWTQIGRASCRERV